MSIKATVKLDLKRLRKFQGKVSSDLNGPHIEKALKQWAYLYRGFAYRRFAQQSKGGGDWPDLADSTIRKRLAKSPQKKKKVKVKGKLVVTKIAILRDTGVLFMVLSPTFIGTPGAIEQRIKFGIRVGFGGAAKHNKKSKTTIADIASYHQTGGDYLPKREIIVSPSSNILSAMSRVMTKALRDEYNGS